MSDGTTFLKQFFRQPTSIGAIAPSGSALARTMVDWFDWDHARGVVEFGPGTGVFTEAILDRLHPDAKFLAIEQSRELAARTRQRCPQAMVVEDSAANVAHWCRQASIERVDAIICGLPWASFSDALQSEILQAVLDVMPPGGQFATFAYWQGVLLPAGQRFARRLRASFQTVQRSPTVWRNLPPAFVYRCTR